MAHTQHYFVEWFLAKLSPEILTSAKHAIFLLPPIVCLVTSTTRTRTIGFSSCRFIFSSNSLATAHRIIEHQVGRDHRVRPSLAQARSRQGPPVLLLLHPPASARSPNESFPKTFEKCIVLNLFFQTGGQGRCWILYLGLSVVGCSTALLQKTRSEFPVNLPCGGSPGKFSCLFRPYRYLLHLLH